MQGFAKNHSFRETIFQGQIFRQIHHCFLAAYTAHFNLGRIIMLGISPFLLLLVLIHPLSGLAYQGSGSSEALQLAETYNHQLTDNTIKAYFVSEKLDGIRARWTGNQLLSGQNLLDTYYRI